MSDLPSELIERVRLRAADPERRTHNSGISAHATDIGSLLGQMGLGGDQLQSMQGMMGQFADIMKGFGVIAPMPVGDRAAAPPAEPLAPPPSDTDLAETEAALGFALPAGLKQLYATIGDGGFGPGDGLFSLAEMVAQYRDMTDEPAGPMGQLWPANLLPLCDQQPGYICLDVESGKVIDWDPEEIEGDSDKYWRRSFKAYADDLAAMLERWLGEPTAMERMQATRSEAANERAELAIDYYAELSPEERAEHGLPEIGWEDEVRRRHDA
jgi:hypothetical protein